MSPFHSWVLVLVVCVGLPALVVWCCCVVAGRASQAEREILEGELATALARNRYPANTIVRTVCKACHQQIDRHYIPFRPDYGAVLIVDGLHLRCRHGSEIEIHLDEFESADHLARHLRTLEGAPEHV